MEVLWSAELLRLTWHVGAILLVVIVVVAPFAVAVQAPVGVRVGIPVGGRVGVGVGVGVGPEERMGKADWLCIVKLRRPEAKPYRSAAAAAASSRLEACVGAEGVSGSRRSARDPRAATLIGGRAGRRLCWAARGGATCALGRRGAGRRVREVAVACPARRLRWRCVAHPLQLRAAGRQQPAAAARRRVGTATRRAGCAGRASGGSYRRRRSWRRAFFRAPCVVLSDQVAAAAVVVVAVVLPVRVAVRTVALLKDVGLGLGLGLG